MARSFFQYFAFTAKKIWSILIIKIYKVGLKCCQILTTPKNIAKFFKISQSGEISSNLVTLVTVFEGLNVAVIEGLSVAVLKGFHMVHCVLQMFDKMLLKST